MMFRAMFIIAVSALSGLQAQTDYPFTATDWTIEGEYALEEFKGRPGLLLKKGAAKLPAVKFKNGVIEYDIAFDRTPGFPGVHFRAQDEANSEQYYLRPHQSGNPDAMQYTPIFNGLAGWQLYHGENHSNAHVFKDNEWMHVKLVVWDDQAEVFIDDLEKPVLHVFDLKRETQEGFLALSSGTPVRFANFKVTALESYDFISEPKVIPTIAPGTVQQWQVSAAFPEKLLDGQVELEKKQLPELKWQPLDSEFTGITNVARVGVFSPENNTLIAKFTIESDRDQVKALAFGYSDIARVYCNGRLLYQGQRIFRSRDYRYLGTIGYFDMVFLHLKKGANEIEFALTENFGGWGVMARFEETEGVRIK